jgi:hypothetical protein
VREFLTVEKFDAFQIYEMKSSSGMLDGSWMNFKT